MDGGMYSIVKALYFNRLDSCILILRDYELCRGEKLCFRL